MTNVMTEHEKKEYTRKVLYLRKNPVVFIEKIMGSPTLEEYQGRICQAVVDYDRVAVKACHAVGKTFVMGNIVPWFVTTHPYSIVITTAPTNRQVEALLWGEIRKAVKRSKTKLGGSLLTKKWTIDDDWYAMGFSPQGGAANGSDEQQGSSFQGFHAKHVMIIFDEATGITKDLYTMAEGLLTSGVTVKWVCIANPTSSASEFFQICKQAEWYVMTINCFDSPNMIANGFTNRAALEKEINELKLLKDADRLLRIKNYKKPNGHLLSAQWVVAKIYNWGWDHPLTKSKILGEFPGKNDDVVVKWDHMMMAMKREPVFEYKKRYIGVDVARFGDDLSVITEITDSTFRGAYPSMKAEISETTGRVVAVFWAGDSGKETHIGVDCTGVGAGVLSDLKEMKRLNELPDYVFLHEIHFANKITHDTEAKNEEFNKTYENLKCFMFDKLNEDLRDHLYMPTEEVYQEETVNILFKFSKKGKLLIEDKETFKKRIKKSPDYSDSLAIANFLRYVKPTYGTFKGIDKPGTPYSNLFNKKSKDRKPGIKISSY